MNYDIIVVVVVWHSVENSIWKWPWTRNGSIIYILM